MVIISIDREGQIAINGTRVHQEMDFNADLHRAGSRQGTPGGHRRGQRDQARPAIIEVIDRLKRLKVQRIGIEVEQQ